MFITSFYSYKGGVGRTVCLLNVAWELALRKKKIVLLDLDLEAPGLHEARLRPVRSEAQEKVNPSTSGLEKGSAWEPTEPSSGILQYFSLWQEAIRNNNYTLPEKFDSELPLRTQLGPDGKLSLLAAGIDADGADYATLLQEFSWADFYDRPYRGREFFEEIVRALESAGYEHLLIDSRTGLTDAQFVSTVHLPDLVVLITNLSAQSIKGTARVLNDIMQVNDECRGAEGSPLRRLDAKKTEIGYIVVGSPIPQGELSMRARQIAWAESGEGLGRPIDHIVDHLPTLAFDESEQILAQKLEGYPETGRNIGPVHTFGAIADDILRNTRAAAENLLRTGEQMLQVGYWRDSSAFFDAASDLEGAAGRDGSSVRFAASLRRARAEATGLVRLPEVKTRLEELEKAPYEPGAEGWTGLAEGWLTLSWSQYLQGEFRESAAAAQQAALKCERALRDSGTGGAMGSEQRRDLKLLKAYANYVEGDARLEGYSWGEAREAFDAALKVYDTLPGVVFQAALSRAALVVAHFQQRDLGRARQELETAERQLRQGLDAKAKQSGGLGDECERPLGDRLWARWYQSAAGLRLAEGNLSICLDYLKRIRGWLVGADSVGVLATRVREFHVGAMYGIPSDDPCLGVNNDDEGLLGKEFIRYTDALRAKAKGSPDGKLEAIELVEFTGELADKLKEEGERIKYDVRKDCARIFLLIGVAELSRIDDGDHRKHCYGKIESKYRELSDWSRRHSNGQTSPHASASKSQGGKADGLRGANDLDVEVEDGFLCLLRLLVMGNVENDKRCPDPDLGRSQPFELRLWHIVVAALDQLVRGGDAEKWIEEGRQDASHGPIALWREIFALLDAATRRTEWVPDRSLSAEVQEAVRDAARVLLMPRLLMASQSVNSQSIGRAIQNSLQSGVRS